MTFSSKQTFDKEPQHKSSLKHNGSSDPKIISSPPLKILSRPSFPSIILSWKYFREKKKCNKSVANQMLFTRRTSRVSIMFSEKGKKKNFRSVTQQPDFSLYLLCYKIFSAFHGNKMIRKEGRKDIERELSSFYLIKRLSSAVQRFIEKQKRSHLKKGFSLLAKVRKIFVLSKTWKLFDAL